MSKKIITANKSPQSSSLGVQGCLVTGDVLFNAGGHTNLHGVYVGMDRWRTRSNERKLIVTRNKG